MSPASDPAGVPAAADYSIWVVEYAHVLQNPMSNLIWGRHNAGTTMVPYAYGVVQGAGRTVLIDTGHDDSGYGHELGESFGVSGWQPPQVVLGRIGVDPADVDTIILTHNHFDHAGNIDAFPNAQVYIQEREVTTFLTTRTLGKRLRWLTLACDPGDLVALVNRWARDKLVLVDGEHEVLPGIRAVPARDSHTPGSQFVVIDDGRGGRFVMAGDLVAVFENLEGADGSGEFIPTGVVLGSTANQLFAMEAMYQAVDGQTTRILPFHEGRLWDRYPSREFADGLHIAEISLRPGLTSAVTG